MKMKMKKYLPALRCVGVAIFVGLFLYAGPERVVEGLRSVRVLPLGLAALCTLAVVILRNARWKYILGYFGGSIRWRELLPLAFVSAFLGNVTPGRVGDLWKMSFAGRGTFSRSACLVSFLYDRMLDAFSMALLAAVCAFMMAETVGKLFLGSVITIVVCGLLAVIFRRQVHAAIKRMLRKYDVGDADPVGRKHHPRQLLCGLSAHLLSLAAYFAIYGFLFAAVGMTVPVSRLIVAGSLAAMVAVLPVSFAGLGTREAVCLYFLKPFYQEPGQVVLAGLLDTILFAYVLTGLIALPMWLLGLPRRSERVMQCVSIDERQC